jgi:hypothetical protein
MGRPWPHDSKEKLETAGYVFVEDGPCKSPKCDKTVKWFRTPKDHLMPFTVREGGALQPHFADCPDARNFTSKGKGAS